MSQGAASTTIFSLCAEIPASPPHGFDDGETLLDAGWLVADDERIACFIRKFSAAGATLKIEQAPAAEAYALTLGNGQAIPGTILWIEEGEAGFLFDAPIDVVGTLARNLAILPDERRRVPRVELHQNVGIRRGGEFEFARTRDLSCAGVGIETNLVLAEDDVVEIAFDGLSTLKGSVKWARHGKAGLAFDDELAWQVLMPWLRQAQTSPLRSPAQRSFDEPSRFKLAGDKKAIRVNAAARVREGARWWNVQVRTLSAHHVEFECPTPLAKGTPLWLWLPGFPGWPASVIDCEGDQYLAEFRVPLRDHDLDQILPTRLAARG